MAGARAILAKTARDAEYAAQIYPKMVRLMDECGVPVLERENVLRMIVQVIGCMDDIGPIN